MTEVPMSFDYAVHSDFLIHWTGKDIDPPNWYNDHRSNTAHDVDDRYLHRLRDILTYGLWMTDGEDKIRIGSNEIPIPITPQCCFTELKLSESRRHAKRYGRLGIGVKRPFLFQRLGRPLTYFGFGEQSVNDKLLGACSQDLRDRRLMHFFKPMNREIEKLTYDFYAESEWRILFFDELMEKGKIIDPRNSSNSKEHAYFNSLKREQQNRLRYLIPLDGWFAAIIYPSLSVKNHAQWDTKYTITEQIKRIKSDASDHGNLVEGAGNSTRGNWPIELDLDACRNF